MATRPRPGRRRLIGRPAGSAPFLPRPPLSDRPITLQGNGRIVTSPLDRSICRQTAIASDVTRSSTVLDHLVTSPGEIPIDPARRRRRLVTSRSRRSSARAALGPAVTSRSRLRSLDLAV
jgi:hypothetical protein